MNFFKDKKKKVQATPKELVKQCSDLKAQLDAVSKELSDFKQEMQKAITKVGIVRYNPFKEAGGDQSFSIALLNNENTGLIVTSHYGKDIQRVYAKPIKEGASEYSLSDEEKEAIEKAKKK